MPFKEYIIYYFYFVLGLNNSFLTFLGAVPVSKFQRLFKPDEDIAPASYTFVNDKHVFKTEGATLR